VGLLTDFWGTEFTFLVMPLLFPDIFINKIFKKPALDYKLLRQIQTSNQITYVASLEVVLLYEKYRNKTHPSTISIG
jgi:hypothetical protein